MNKVLMSFEENFWGNCDWLMLAGEERGKFTHSYDFSHDGKNILVCFLTEDFARKAQQYTDSQLVSELI